MQARVEGRRAQCTTRRRNKACAKGAQRRTVQGRLTLSEGRRWTVAQRPRTEQRQAITEKPREATGRFGRARPTTTTTSYVYERQATTSCVRQPSVTSQDLRARTTKAWSRQHRTVHAPMNDGSASRHCVIMMDKSECARRMYTTGTNERMQRTNSPLQSANDHGSRRNRWQGCAGTGTPSGPLEPPPIPPRPGGCLWEGCPRHVQGHIGRRIHKCGRPRVHVTNAHR